MKKFILGIIALLVIAAGALFAINGKSNYDPTKYSLSITPKDKAFGVGSKIDFTLPDQFNKAHTLKNDDKKLVFVFTKDTGHILKEYMKGKDKKFVEDKKLVLVADVSGMPTVILNTFALPDFQKSNYPMLLIYDKNMAQQLKEGQDTSKVVVLSLDNKKVTKIEHAANQKELDKLLNK